MSSDIIVSFPTARYLQAHGCYGDLDPLFDPNRHAHAADPRKLSPGSLE